MQTTPSFEWPVPAVLRGEVLQSGDISVPGRRGSAVLRVPRIADLAERLPLRNPADLADLNALSLADIVDFLGEVGTRLTLANNPLLREAYELSRVTSGLSDGVLLEVYANVARCFDPSRIWETVGNAGLAALEDWAPSPDGRTQVRALGARTVHVIAGNVPTIAAVSIVNGAITRSDSIIKLPSNDALTAVAIARTMVELDPAHPLTRHLCVCYWKGGDEAFESRLYQPAHIDKIVAWGGPASITSIRRLLVPGIDVITLDPKRSCSIVGPSAFASEAKMRDAARALARDAGILNQEACFNSRLAYVACGTDGRGVALANRLGELTFEALRELPAHESAPHKSFDPLLRSEIDGLKFAPDEFCVFGGKAAEGAVIVSQSEEPVDFADRLACRVLNIVPMPCPDAALRRMGAHTQTVGVYPDELRDELRDALAVRGVQRIVSLGRAGDEGSPGAPQDGLELLRRMCRWCVQEIQPPKRKRK